MANITKLNLYLNDEQYQKLCLVAESENKSPEEVANNAVYGYLAIVDPFAKDYDDMTPEEQAEYDRKLEEEFGPLDEE